MNQKAMEEENSIEFDENPTDPSDIWDIISLTNGFEQRIVSKRGEGTFTSPEFEPAVWELTAGSHTLTIRGRERNTLLKSISIIPVGTPGGRPPISPDGLRFTLN